MEYSDYKYYFLTDEEVDKVTDIEDVEELLWEKGIKAYNVEFDGDNMVTYRLDVTEYSDAPDPMDIAKDRMLEAGFGTYLY